MRLSLSLVLVGALTLAGTASGDDKKLTFRAEDPDATKPYVELISKGEASFAARDIPGATAAFQDAIKLDPNRMFGFYRLGEAQLAGGKPADAEATWQSGVTKKGPESMQAKLLFIIAEVRERQHKLPQAKEGWAAYTAFLTGHPTVKGFPQVAESHQKVIDRRMKDEVVYGAVKERIEKRLKEKEAEALANAKKDAARNK